MFCICATQLSTLLSTAAQLQLGVSLPPIPPLLMNFAAATGVAPASASLVAQLQGLLIPHIPILQGSATLSGLAALATTASALGLDLATSAGISAIADLCAQLNLGLLAPLMQIPAGAAAQLSATLNVALQLGAALGVDMFAANAQGSIAAAAQASVQASLALTPPGFAPAGLQAVARLQVLVQLGAAFGIPLTAAGMAQLAVTLRALIGLNIPQTAVPPALSSVAVALRVAVSSGALASGGLAAMMAALSVNLQLVLRALLQLNWAPPPFAPPASLSAVLGMDLQALAALNWSVPAQLPVVTFGLPALSLIAALNAASPILATVSCGACSVLRA
jgi:hypothetical protein